MNALVKVRTPDHAFWVRHIIIIDGLILNDNLLQGCTEKFQEEKDLINHVNVHHVKCERDEEYKCYWLNCPRKGKGFNAR